MCRLVLCLVLAFVVKGHAQRTPSCTSLGGSARCVLQSQACPTGTEENKAYSNYIACGDLSLKCCAPMSADTLARQRCGIGSLDSFSKILDGSATSACDWPFVVSLRSLKLNSSGLTYDGTTHACQGVLVDTDWVLTSAFCLLSAGSDLYQASSKILVVAGEYDVSTIDYDPASPGQRQEQLIEVASVFIHPAYNFTSQAAYIPFFNDAVALNSNDVALIKLRDPIAGKCSGIVCLPTAEEAANGCAFYDDCVITGWGTGVQSSTLLSGRVRLSSSKACDFLTTRLGLANVRPAGSICQSPSGAGTDSCLGDEGGAVMCYTGRNWVVRGILPFNMCVNGQFNLYVTETAPYLSWIEQTMANNS